MIRAAGAGRVRESMAVLGDYRGRGRGTSGADVWIILARRNLRDGRAV